MDRPGLMNAVWPNTQRYRFCIIFVFFFIYIVVPIFNISPDVVPRVTDEEMQKTILGKGKHHSFSSHCKKLLGIKEKLKDKTVDAEVREVKGM